MVIKSKKRFIPTKIFKRHLLVILSAIILILFLTFRNSSNIIRISGSIIFMFFFYLFDHNLKIDFPIRYYLYIIIIAISGILMSKMYFVYPQYDKVLHFILPILVSSIYYYMVSKLNINLRWKLLFTFLAVISTLAVFEIVEYSVDYLFDWKLQGVFQYQGDRWGFGGLSNFKLLVEPIDDTMIDLFFGLLGSLLFWVITYIKEIRKEKTLKKT